MTTTPDTLAKLAASQRKDAVFSAALAFMGELTGMAPPPIEIAPPEVFKPFRDFTEKVCAIFDSALTAQALPAAEPVRWEYRWTNPSNDPGRTSDTEWKDVAPRWNQTIEQACHELEGYHHDGKPCYEVRALYTTPQAAQQAAQAPAGWVPSREDFDLFRQWFDSVQDTNGGYLNKADYVLAAKLYKHLEMRIPSSIGGPAALPQPQPQSAQSKGDV